MAGRRAAAARLAAAATLVAALAGCTGASGTTAGTGTGGPGLIATADAATTADAGTATAAGGTGELPDGWSWVATSRVPRLDTRAEPAGPVERTLDHPNRNGGPLVLLVTQRQPGWLRVQLPVRPNGTTAWVAEVDVELHRTPYRLVVHRARHRLEVYREGQQLTRYPVGIGTAVDPTPTGTYYLSDLIQPPDQDGPYGWYAYGLSAFSDTRMTFAGGPGQIGLHGTNRPATVGTDVSNGCLRLTNEAIRDLVGILPLGTPIEIHP